MSKLCCQMPSLRRISSQGYLRLDRTLAGDFVKVIQCEPGVWMIHHVPKSEAWLHEPKAAAALERAIAWAQSHPPAESDPDIEN